MVAGLDIVARKTIPEVVQRLGRTTGPTTWSKMVGNLTPEARKVLPNHFQPNQLATLSRAADSQPDKVGEIITAVNNNDSWGIEAGQRFADGIQGREASELRRQPETLEPKPPQNIANNFTVKPENLVPGIEKTNLENEKAALLEWHRKAQAIQGDPGESGLSIKSTLGQLEGQERGFNFESAEQKAELVGRPVGGTTIKKIKGRSGRTRTEVLAEIARMPYLELHHIFGKAMGAKIIDNVWRLIEAVPPKASLEDLINLNHWAKEYGTGLGDFGTEAVNRIAHSDTHAFSRNFGIEMSSADIKAMPVFDDMDELTSYFRELLETRVKPMRAELDLQQGAYNLLPEKMRLDVEMLKVAKEDASRDLTQSYKEKYKKKMKDTPKEVKATYQTHKWIQEELGVTEPELIEKARKLDQARKAQKEQLAQARKELTRNKGDIIRLAESKQDAKEAQSEILPRATTRSGYGEEYAANRIDPKVATERKILEAGSPTSEADRLAMIERIKSGEKPEDILYQDSTGKWNKRKTRKKQPKKK